MVGCRRPPGRGRELRDALLGLRPRLSLFYGENDRETQTTCGHWGSEGSRISGATPPLAPVFPRTDRHAEEASFALETVGSNFEPRHYPFAAQNRVRESAPAVGSLDSTADMISGKYRLAIPLVAYGAAGRSAGALALRPARCSYSLKSSSTPHRPHRRLSSCHRPP